MALRRALGEETRDLRFAGAQRLKARVFRLRFEGPGGARPVVVKRLDWIAAARNESVERRWLPAVGLAENGPGLLRTLMGR